MTEDEYVVVYEAQTELDSSICQAILEDAGIPVVVQPISEVWKRVYFGLQDNPVAQLLVPAADAARAKTLLAEYQAQLEAGAFALKEDDEDNE